MTARVEARRIRRRAPALALRARGTIQLRARTIGRLARRDLLAALRGPAIYLLATLAALVAGVTLKAYLDYLAGNGIAVLASPLQSPLLIAIFVLTGYVGLAAAASVAAEKERGTLEVLFYGPVDAWTFVGGKLLGHLLIYGVLIAWLGLYLALAAALSGFAVDLAALGLLVLSLLPAGCLIAFGVLLAVLTGRVRRALALMLVLLLALLAIDLGSALAAAQPADSTLGSAAALLAALAAVSAWLSPFSYLSRAVDGLGRGALLDVVVNLAAALLLCVAAGCGSVALLRRVGVQRWRE